MIRTYLFGNTIGFWCVLPFGSVLHQSCYVPSFCSPSATFAAVRDANKTLDKPAEACQG